MEQHVFDDCIGNPPFEEACRYAPGRRHGQREKACRHREAVYQLFRKHAKEIERHEA